MPFYPILFGIFPVLALIAFNFSQVDLSWVYRSFLLSVVLSTVLLALLWLALRNPARAAVLTSLLLVLFFFYGHAYSALGNTRLLGIALGQHRLLAPVWLGLAGLAVWISTRKSANFAAATPVLTIVSSALLIYPLLQIVRFEWNNRPPRIAETAPTEALSPSKQPYPDIYYIILDAYGRADALLQGYGYDNSIFLNALTERGFYVANCSQSNYAYTNLSLASTLNLDYLDKLPSSNDDQVNQAVQTNVIRQFMKTHGYTIVAFESGYRWSQWEDADLYFVYRPGASALNEFEFLFLQTTLVRLPLDILASTGQSTSVEAIHRLRHDRILYDLRVLEDLPGQVKSPKFVFAHLVIPHPPFVFGPNGMLVTEGAEDASNIAGYRNSVTFINQQMLHVVDHIIASSKTPPVIVIQGDHGAPLFVSRPVQRMEILNAYYLPGVVTRLYPSVSPVNTFRIILDAYFGQDYLLLKDVSWYSPTANHFDFETIPNECNQ